MEKQTIAEGQAVLTKEQAVYVAAGYRSWVHPAISSFVIEAGRIVGEYHRTLLICEINAILYPPQYYRMTDVDKIAALVGLREFVETLEIENE